MSGENLDSPYRLRVHNEKNNLKQFQAFPVLPSILFCSEMNTLVHILQILQPDSDKAN